MLQTLHVSRQFSLKHSTQVHSLSSSAPAPTPSPESSQSKNFAAPFALAISVLAAAQSLHVKRCKKPLTRFIRLQSRCALNANTDEFDVVVIGSGIGGLCAAGTLASYGQRVVVCEAHTHPGGAAHGFDVKSKPSDGGGVFSFDTGPSFFSGLSSEDGARINPLKSVLDNLGVEVPCHRYSSFGLILPEGNFIHSPDFGKQVLKAVSGSGASKEWDQLLDAMKPLARAVEALPVAALRTDVGALLSVAQFLPNFMLLPGGPFAASSLNQPFSSTLDSAGVKDRFARRWLDLLCFCLSGLPANGTVTAEMAMMFGEFYKPGAVMDYPCGGVKSIVAALVSGLEKHGGQLRLNTPVKQVLVESNRATGIVLESGNIIPARSVISGASIWDTLKLLPPESIPASWVKERASTPAAKSFMHLHLGFDTSGLNMSNLQPHYVCLKDWARGVPAEENTVLISIPSVEDDTLAPSNHGVLHAYTPATEPWSSWEGLKRGTPEYEAKKKEKAEFIWRFVEQVIPDIRARSKIVRIGTPLTHQRFLRRHQGTYGPALIAGEASFPGPSTPLQGLVLCGDSCFPGIGVPAVAASGLLAAHSTGLETLSAQLNMLNKFSSK